MISFRFHVVSITAIFLAIAIGVVVGTTYVDGAVVDGLRNRIGSVSKTLDERKRQNDDLSSQLDSIQGYLDRSAAYAVSGRLPGVPVLVLAARGVDEGSVQDVTALVRQAGAETPGVVWLEDRWSLANAEDRTTLVGIIGGRTTDSTGVLWERAWSAVVDEVTEAPVSATPPTSTTTTPGSGATTTTTVAPTPAAPVLAALEAAGFLSLDALGDDSVGLADLGGTSARVLLVTGARARDEVTTMLPVVVDAPVAAGLATVVADVYVDAPEAPARSASATRLLPAGDPAGLAIVDDAERPEGQVGAVLALDAVGDGRSGHFGYGDGADAVLPTWTPP